VEFVGLRTRDVVPDHNYTHIIPDLTYEVTYGFGGPGRLVHFLSDDAIFEDGERYIISADGLGHSLRLRCAYHITKTAEGSFLSLQTQLFRGTPYCITDEIYKPKWADRDADSRRFLPDLWREKIVQIGHRNTRL